MTWELIKIETEQDCTMDDSGIYTIINRKRIAEHSKGYFARIVEIRVDIMGDDDSPIISFVGKSEAVRKAVMNWLSDNDYVVSLEHASYIGSEIARANLCEHYVQM